MKIKKYNEEYNSRFKIIYKYKQYLIDKFDAVYVTFYTDYNVKKIKIYFKKISKVELKNITDFFDDVNYEISQTDNAIRIDIFDITESFMEKVDLDMETKKYNL